MYLNIKEKDQVLWTHSSLLANERFQAIKKLKDGQGSFINKFSFVFTYFSLEVVNRVKPLKKLSLYYRAGIVGATFVASRFIGCWAYNASIDSEIKRNLDGSPVWENKFNVPELDKKFFFLDDDNNFEPSLWHHGISTIDKPKRFYRYQ